jgi:hypothetical protein
VFEEEAPEDPGRDLPEVEHRHCSREDCSDRICAIHPTVVDSRAPVPDPERKPAVPR